LDISDISDSSESSEARKYQETLIDEEKDHFNILEENYIEFDFNPKIEILEEVLHQGETSIEQTEEEISVYEAKKELS
jgi:hypothetical protein